MRTAKQIIGEDKYLQLVFEGYEVVFAAHIAELEAALREVLDSLPTASWAEPAKRARMILEKR